MALTLEVVDKDGTLPPPPENFPTCGPFEVPRQQLNSKHGATQVCVWKGEGGGKGEGWWWLWSVCMFVRGGCTCQRVFSFSLSLYALLL